MTIFNSYVSLPEGIVIIFAKMQVPVFPRPTVLPICSSKEFFEIVGHFRDELERRMQLQDDDE